jgi:hypothetical protein
MLEELGQVGGALEVRLVKRVRVERILTLWLVLDHYNAK